VTHGFPLEQIAEGYRVASEREADPIEVAFAP
jgi:hypothetical protein